MSDISPKISVIIPAHNEGDTLPDVVESVIKVVRCLQEVIIVDDNSTDATLKMADDLSKKHKSVTTIHRSSIPCFGSAIMDGFRASRGRYIVFVMADRCDDPTTINQMYDIMSNHDVVVGSRYSKGGKRTGGVSLKSIFSRICALAFHHIIGVPTHDVVNAFKMYRRDVLDNVEPMSKGYAISLELTVRAYLEGYRITEVPTVWRSRTGGKSKFSMLKMGFEYISLLVYSLKLKTTASFNKTTDRSVQ